MPVCDCVHTYILSPGMSLHVVCEGTCAYMYNLMGVEVKVCAFWLITQLLEVSAISITKESTHNATKGAHGVAMKTKAANNDSVLSEEYLKVRQAELKEQV